MLKLAIHNNPNFTISDFEIRRNTTSYSIFTIEHFQKKLGSKATLFFLMGMDSFSEISTWKDFERLFFLTNFIIMSRPGYSKKEISKLMPAEVAKNFYCNFQKNCYIHSSGHKIFFQEITLLAISSRAIRSQIKNFGSIRYLVPPEVEDYIKKYRLYQE